MKVILPTAGLGSRLRPHTYTMPKALLPVAGKPIIGHILDQVISWGGDRITLIVGYLGDQIEKYVHAHYRLEMEFRVQERALGLGHAVLTGLDPEDRELLVVLGDTILDSDLLPVIGKGVTSIGVKEVEDPRKLGVVVMEGDKVTRLVEKPVEPVSNLAIVGIYYFSDGRILGRAIKEVIERGITVKGEYQITDALQMMVEWGEVVETFPVNGWYDCGKPENLLETNRYLFDRDGSVYETHIANNAILIEPVAIGAGVRIERSVVGPYVSVGADSVIQDSIIRDSIIGVDTHIRRELIAEALVGNKAHLFGDYHRYNIGSSSQIGTII